MDREQRASAPSPAPGSAADARTGLRLRVTPLTVIAAAVIALLLISQFAVGNFFSYSTLATITPLIAVLIIVAIGQAFVIGTGGIDLSVPATITLVGVILLKASGGEDGGLVEALLLCAAACIVIGLINGLLVEGLALNALVVTLATGQLIAGFTRDYRGQLLDVTDVPPQLSDAAGANVGGVSYLLIIAAIVSVAGTIFLHRVVYGRRLVASSASKRAAFLAGLRARRYRILAYVIASLTYGLAGVLLAGDVKTPDLTLGDPYLLSSVVAVVLGGAVLTGGRVSPVATLLGAVFLVVLDHDLRVEGLSAGVRLIVQGCVLALGLTLVFLIQNFQSIQKAIRRRAGPAQVAVTPGTTN
jgi:ribose transport system permease protein